MARFVGRVGDIVGPGGSIVTPVVPTVLVNGIPICVVGALVSPHPPCPEEPSHCAATIQTGNPTVLAGGLHVSGVGDIASCADAIASGSTDTLIG